MGAHNKVTGATFRPRGQERDLIFRHKAAPHAMAMHHGHGHGLFPSQTRIAPLSAGMTLPSLTPPWL